MRGALLMTAAMAAFTFNDACMKAATETMPLMQAIALRGLLTVLVLALIGWRGKSLTLRIQRSDLRQLGLRALGEVSSTFAFLTALTHMPIANLSAVMQSLPLMVTLGAAFFLGDPIGWRRMTAILVGLAGVLVIIRPGSGGFDHWALMGVAAVLGVVLRDLSTRNMSQRLPSVTVAFFSASSVTVAAAIGSAFEGTRPVANNEAALILGASGFIIVGYLTGVMAVRVGDIGTVAPFRYTGLVFAIFLGWVAFGQFPDGWTLVGSAIVVATGIYSFHRERLLARRARATVTNARSPAGPN